MKYGSQTTTETGEKTCQKTTSCQLSEYGLSQNQLAKGLGVSANRIAEIVNNRLRITADTALRLGLYFGTSPEFWLNLQMHPDLKMARRSLKPEDIKRIKTRQSV